MEIHGFNKTTLLDYPEHIAATVLQEAAIFAVRSVTMGNWYWIPDASRLFRRRKCLLI